MGLVDYSESDSDSDSAPTQPRQPPRKKPFQKVVDRANGKIVVNLAPSAAATPPDQPPPKRARTTAGSLFKDFNALLPPPKNAAAAAAAGPSRQIRPGIHLQTSAEAGFARAADPSAPSIPESMKPASEVQLVGKPLLFKPLSVARNAKKKTTKPPPPAPAPAAAAPPAAPAPAPQSLFSMHVEEASSASTGPYEPLFTHDDSIMDSNNDNDNIPVPNAQPPPQANPSSLHSVADDLNLSAAARRELFGRSGRDSSVLTFDTDREYQHNEGLRAAGDQQLHNPVRAIQGGGKHSLRQLVHNVVNQRDALEDSFAKGKSNRKEASSKYGW